MGLTYYKSHHGDEANILTASADADHTVRMTTECKFTDDGNRAVTSPEWSQGVTNFIFLFQGIFLEAKKSHKTRRT